MMRSPASLMVASRSLIRRVIAQVMLNILVVNRLQAIGLQLDGTLQVKVESVLRITTL